MNTGIRVVAYCLQFLPNFRRKKTRVPYMEEIATLKEKKPTSKTQRSPLTIPDLARTWSTASRWSPMALVACRFISTSTNPSKEVPIELALYRPRLQSFLSQWTHLISLSADKRPLSDQDETGEAIHQFGPRFATKAIHLKAVSDILTATILAACRRFTSRRGLCRRLYSDNGTNIDNWHTSKERTLI